MVNQANQARYEGNRGQGSTLGCPRSRGFQGTCMYACGDGVDHRPTDELDSSPAEFAAAILVGLNPRRTATTSASFE